MRSSITLTYPANEYLQARADDLLKISQTSLEEILHQEGNSSLFTAPALTRQNSNVTTTSQPSLSDKTGKAGAVGGKRKRDLSFSGAGNVSLQDLPAEARSLLVAQIQGMTGRREVTEEDIEDLLRGTANEGEGEGEEEGDSEGMDQSEDEGDEEEEEEGEGSVDEEGDSDAEGSDGDKLDAEGRNGTSHTPAKRARTVGDPTTDASATSASSNGLPPALSSPSAGSDSSLKPYPAEGQLEFLDDCFQMIALMIKGNVARMKDDMKKEGATSRYNSYEGSGELKHSRRELTAKLRLQESRIQIRLKKTEEAGHPLPRLEVMNQRFHLDPFEKRIILLLIGECCCYSALY